MVGGVTSRRKGSSNILTIREQKPLDVTARQPVRTLPVVGGQALHGFEIRLLRGGCQAPKRHILVHTLPQDTHGVLLLE
jgi:hypothetical protein